MNQKYTLLLVTQIINAMSELITKLEALEYELEKATLPPWRKRPAKKRRSLARPKKWKLS